MTEQLDRRGRIEVMLRDYFDPVHLEVVDESHLHVGHAGARGGLGHFRAVIVSERFEGRSPVDRQRLVYAALGEQIGTEIHALSLETFTPKQWRRSSPCGAQSAAR